MIMPPIAIVSPSSTVTCVLTLRCEKDGELMPLPALPEAASGLGIGAVTSWLITIVTTPLGLTRARIVRPIPVLVFEIELVKRELPFCCTLEVAIELTVGTESPTVIEAGMLSVAIKLGADSTFVLLVLSLAWSSASNCLLCPTRVPAVRAIPPAPRDPSNCCAGTVAFVAPRF